MMGAEGCPTTKWPLPGYKVGFMIIMLMATHITSKLLIFTLREVPIL